MITNFLLNFLISLLFPIEIEYIGTSNTFLIYTIILILGLLFISKYIPETKGLTLEEIEEFFIKNAKINNNNNNYNNNSNNK